MFLSRWLDWIILKNQVGKLFIYALKDPRTDEVRYVGQTSVGMVRPRIHKTPSVLKLHPRPFRRWVNQLRALGLMYEIDVIETVTDTHQLNPVETKWIKDFRSRGFDLLNWTDGGGGIRGFRHTESTKEKIRAKRGPALAALNKSRAGQPFTEEHCQNLSASMKTSEKAKSALDRAHEARRGVRPSEAAIQALTMFARLPRSSQHRTHIADALRGKAKTPEHTRNSVLAKQQKRSIRQAGE